MPPIKPKTDSKLVKLLPGLKTSTQTRSPQQYIKMSHFLTDLESVQGFGHYSLPLYRQEKIGEHDIHQACQKGLCDYSTKKYLNTGNISNKV